MATDLTLDAPVTAAPETKSLARHLTTAARVLMGLLFFVFGLNGFLNFIPPPTEPLPEAAVAFSTALAKSGYLFQLIKGTEVLVGALLLANRFVPLALALIAPIVVNIVAFHVFLLPMGMGMTAFVLALELYLAWAYRGAFRSMLVMRAVPGAK
jgi:uncharacterized membrane protein YphA (DoxX/SURF4 family)